MEEKRIQSILRDTLEDEIPSSEVQLWPDVKASLVAGKNFSLRQGEKMNTTQLRSLPRLAFAIVMIVVLLAIALITPQGRSFAQTVLSFFTRTNSTSFPLEPSQIVDGETAAATAPTAAAPAPLMSIAEARDQLGFEIVELPFVPDGFIFLGARISGNAVNIAYETPDKGGHLSIQQSLKGFNQSEWDQVPAEAIIPVKIGEVDGEFVQGTFVVYPNETSATWNPDMAMMRLRWEQDGIWFEIAKYGNVEAIEYLDQTGIIKLAESLTIRP